MCRQAYVDCGIWIVLVELIYYISRILVKVILILILWIREIMSNDNYLKHNSSIAINKYYGNSAFLFDEYALLCQLLWLIGLMNKIMYAIEELMYSSMR